MTAGSPTLAETLDLLAQAPKHMARLTGDLTPVQLRTAPSDGEWSIVDVLAHLRACADVWGACIATMLAEDHPTIRAIDPRTWIEQTDYRELAFAPSFAAYSAQRADLLAVLERLSPDAWSRAATVTGAGKPLERTVLAYARRLAKHERRHLGQIARIATVTRA